MSEINQEVLGNSIEIWDGLPNSLHETPYMPCNGTEGDLFISHWCHTCENDNKDTGKCCNILTLSFCGEQQKEWTYFEDKPICTAYKKRKY